MASAFHHMGSMNGNDSSGGEPGASDRSPGGLEASQRVDGTNVVRVPFGVRRARRRRPERPDHWATLVLPFQAGGGGSPTPPHAA
ncbi:hypothetical protein [Synechococcus sp. CCY 9618]|uniref:hypothetical protein n=1 Tax=Synechococcus sp. CCY 9618 TaxID=2815602 RepID=UPI001C226620|nr:hypothetical protein [Synechococcus sp. CCY 9618]